MKDLTAVNEWIENCEECESPTCNGLQLGKLAKKMMEAKNEFDTLGEADRQIVHNMIK